MHELLSRILEELRYAWRFRWHGALVAWLICIAGWLLVYSLPNVYQVKARVRIDTTSAIYPLIADLTVSPDVNQQVDLLIHTVLSTPNLEEIARSTGLDIQATTPAAKERLLERLGSRIDIENERNQINLYSIAYTGNDANKARAIVQEVINIMTGMALGNSVLESERAMAFLSRKVEDYRTQLHAIEEKLTEFKKAHPELMEGRGGYLARLQTTRAVVAQLETQLKTLQNKRAALQEQLAALASGSVTIPPAQSQQVRAIDARIAQYRSQLTQLLTRYTPQHPDVIRTRAVIDRLQGERQELIAQLRANPQRAYSVNSAAYRQVQQQLNEIEIEIDTLRATVDQKSLQTRVLESNSDQATDAQSELAELSRNYAITKTQYELLLTRLNTARLSKDVATFGDRLDFRIVDPPEIPDVASGPPRILFMFAVLLAGLGGGAVFAFFLSQIRPVFMTRRKLTQVTGLPVLGAVSMAWNIRQRIRRRTSLAMFALAIGGLFVCFIAAVALVPVGIQIVPAILGRQWL